MKKAFVIVLVLVVPILFEYVKSMNYNEDCFNVCDRACNVYDEVKCEEKETSCSDVCDPDCYDYDEVKCNEEGEPSFFEEEGDEEDDEEEAEAEEVADCFDLF